MKVTVTFSVAVAVAVLCFINAIVYKFRKLWVTNNNFSEVEKRPLNAADKPRCRRFSLAEIKSATDNFSDALVVGRGGFGNVYKGLIDEGKETVAIKRLRPDSRQGQREFWTEIKMLSELRHVNLVSLIGYCNEEGEMILVYDHMPRGTLADYLYKRDGKISVRASLTWKQRLMICIGAGRGLDYLHTGHRVIHRDVKPSNILLDENLVAKFSDFGLARIQIGRDSQTQESTNLKGTFGFIDPEFFRTRTLTRKSDTYSFGVVLLEVLCGRKAIDRSLEDNRRSLTVWARESISKGDVDVVMDPRLRGRISPGSLKAFLNITERCLDDVPKKRPRISHVVMNLEFALELQGNVNLLVQNRVSDAVDIFPCVCKIQQDPAKTSLPNEKSGISGFFPRTARFFFSGRASSDVLNVTAPQMTTMSQIIPSAPPKGSGKKISKLPQCWPFDVFRNKTRRARTDFGGISRTCIGWVTLDDDIVSPLSLRTNKDPASKFNGSSGKLELASHYLLPTPNLKVFSFSELRTATRNFRPDTILGKGGFGRVYKGWLSDGNTTTVVAVKLLSRESTQGLKEWESEVTVLGRLSHPNLVKLLGYCREAEQLLLVYEYMEKGSLENHIFRRGDAAQTLSWDMRLRILTGAARGLAFLHGFENKIIYRDFKTSNILLDESYEAKLSDFGLAKLGPVASQSHVTTQIMGTYGYAAPEYIATGHLYVKSDVYGFGVCALEMLTGLRTYDASRPSGQQSLVEWAKPLLRKRKLKQVIDTRLEGNYSLAAASQMAQLALDCLEYDPKRRPPMKRVVEILERAHSVTEESRQQARLRFVKSSFL